ncbi:sugar-binding protein [Paenibacillus sp. MMO-177]|uniref:sugar-binding protein n=1 Tax=Paenibacillus sp. MMO-177 TaxID=3081289 RepID=UPI003015D06D
MLKHAKILAQRCKPALMAFLCLIVCLSMFPVEAPPIAAAASSNVLANGDFEEGTANWAASGGNNFQVVDDASIAHGGSKALKIDGAIGAYERYEQQVPVEDNVDYILSGYIKSNAGDGAVEIFFPWDNSSAKWIQVTQTDSWEAFSVTISPKTNKYLSIKHVSDSVVYLDDLSLVKKEAGPVKTIVSFTDASVTTQKDIVPQLPSTINVTYSDQSTGLETVVWDSIDPDQYANTGTFQVEGHVAGTALTVKCTVTVSLPSEGKEYFMSSTGSDQNDGSLNSPFATVAHFVSLAKPGDTLYIRGGFYEQSTDITCSGTENAWITIRNYPNEVPIFDGSDYWHTGSSSKTRIAAFFGNAGSNYIVIQGLVMQNYIMSAVTIGYREKDSNGQYIGAPATHYKIRYNLVDRIGQNGISSGSGASDITYENNIVGRTGYDTTFGSWSSGLNFLDLNGSENYVRNNVSYQNIDVSARHTDGNGMILDTSGPHTSVVVENNLFFMNGGVGLAWTDASNAIIRNNTLYENGQDPDYVNGPTGMAFWEAHHNIDLSNNIVYQRNKNGLKTNIPFDEDSEIIANNISGQPGAHNPKFKDPANADFTLADDSPDIDRGYSSKGPQDTVVFDHRALKKQTTGQPVDWFTFAPDMDYIIGKGGLEHIFTPAEREAENGRVDLGAFSTSYTNSNPDAVIPDEELPPEPPKAVELLSNQGFETGIAGWSALESSISSINSIQACQSGYQCLQISGRTAFWNGIYQSITSKVKNDKTYNVSGYVKLPDQAAATGKQIALYVKIVMDSDPVNGQGTKDGNTYMIGKVTPSATGWQQIAGTISTPSSGKIEEFQLLVQGAPDWNGDPDAYNDTTPILVDNLSIKEQLGKTNLLTNAAKGKPDAIDAKADRAWDFLNETKLSDSASFKTLWDEGNLYLLMYVKDSTIDSRDHVDIFINGDYDKQSSYEGDNDRMLRVSRSGVTSGGSFNAVVKEIPGGYIVESKIPFPAKTLSKSQLIGFDIKLTNNDQEVAWNNTDLNQADDKQTLGKLQLVEQNENKAYVPKGTPKLELQSGIDPLWSKGAELRTEIKTGESQKKGTFRLLWDDQYLYVLAHVTGSTSLNKDNVNVYEQDSIEFFKDENNQKTPLYQNDDGQFRINYANEQSINSKKAEELVSYAKADGTEYWISAKMKWTLGHSVDDVLGLDLQINDTNGTSGRTGTLNWSDGTGQGWQSTEGYGSIKLAAAPDPTDNPPDTPATGNTVIDYTPRITVKAGTVSIIPEESVSSPDITLSDTVLQTAIQTALTNNNSLVIKLEAIGALNQVRFHLPAVSMLEAQKKGIQSIIFQTPFLTMTMKTDAIKELEANKESFLVELHNGKTETVNGPNRQQPVMVYDVSLFVDGQPIHTFKTDKSVSLQIPYVLKAGEKAYGVVAAYVSDNHGLDIISSSSYETSTGMVYFIPAHFSRFTILSSKDKFNDLATVPWAAESIEGLAARGMLAGTGNKQFSPGLAVTRAEFVSMLAAFFSETAPASNSFTDVTPGAWYSRSISAAAGLGLVEGYKDGSFGPNRFITRQEMAVMTRRAIQILQLNLPERPVSSFKDDKKIAEYAKDSVIQLRAAGLLNGDQAGKFNPSQKATRAESAVLLYKLFMQLQKQS